MTEISLSELNNLDNYTVIDIRDKIAFGYGSIDGAVNIPQRDIMNNLDLLDKSKLIIVMCKSGIISDTVAEELRNKGYNAVNLKEGYYGYMLQNLTVDSNKAKEIERSINKKFHKEIWSRFTAAINDYELLQEGDKVAVCISGGKDSMLMAKLFQELKRHNKYPFEVVYLVMDPGYSPENREIIERNAKMLGIPITVFETNIFESVLHIEKSPCYICARMRRGYLYSNAKELGCNKIALGHHFDDVIETTLMGMLHSGQIQAMLPKLHSTNFEGMELIRPLYLIHEKDIKHWRDYNGLHFLQCACKFTDTCTSCNPDNASKKKSNKTLIAIIIAIIVIIVAVIAVVTSKGGSKNTNSNKSKEQEKAKITIAVPNDTTNEARALLLLQEQGYIKLDESKGITATISDISENPYGIEFKEVEAAQLPNVLQDVDFAVINSNYAIEGGLNPVKDGLAIEGSSSAYGNILAVKEGNENTDAVKALSAALQSQKVADYIASNYDGAVISVVDNPTDGYDSSVDYDALKGTTISVAASPTPHAEILTVAKEILAEKDITLDIKEFTDYVQPNNVVDSGEIDANYFQHQPYLDDFNAENNTNVVSVAVIHVEPIAIYGGKQTSLDVIKK